METSLLVSGKTTKQMDKESTYTRMVRSMKGHGLTIFKKDRVLKHGQTAPNMKGHIRQERNMDMETIFGPISPATLGTGKKTR